MQPEQKGKPDKPSTTDRWRERAADTKRLVREPAYAREYFPRIFVRAWRTKGGGWYGIGYLITFLYLEVNMTWQELRTSDSAGEFIGSNVVEIFGRWFGESIMNMVQAFMWPATIIEWFGGLAGAAVLVAIHLAFEHFVRPLAEARFPELAEDRLEREARKAEKQRKKTARREQKGSDKT